MEGLVKNELISLGMNRVTCQNGSVWFEGTILDAYKANLWLHTADRVLLVLGQEEIRTFSQLYDFVRALPWCRFLSKNSAFNVSGKCIKSQLMSVRDCQRIIKKAIVDTLCDQYHTSFCPETEELFPVYFSIVKDKFLISFDTSGAGLNRRGYRTWNGDAPIRETLAAALLLLSPWKKHSDEMVLCDPCCGTGTILIEGAMIAANMAPGLHRSFAMEKWRFFEQAQLRNIKDEAAACKKEIPPGRIFGNDIDPSALDLCRKHIRQAGFNEQLIRLNRGDIRDYSFPLTSKEPVCIITNPPYGERMGEKKECEALYAVLHKFYKQTFASYLSAIAPNPGFEKYFGEKAHKKYRFYNGNIECVNYIYDSRG